MTAVKLFRALGCALIAACPICPRAVATPLTNSDAIQIQSIRDSCSPDRETVVYSPDMTHFLVYATRGRLADNQVEETIRIYDSAAVANFADNEASRVAPEPVWEIRRRNIQGPVINNCVWSADSRGIAFLERSGLGTKALMFGDLQSREVRQLSLPGQQVDQVSVIDRQRFAYRVPFGGVLAADHSSDPLVTVTGNYLSAILNPTQVNDRGLTNDNQSPTAHLWAATGEAPHEIRFHGAPVVVGNESVNELTLSPDGTRVATLMPVDNVPSDWERMYPPPSLAAQRRIQAGVQDLQSSHGVRRYVNIDLGSGVAAPLTDGPDGWDAGWPGIATARWSPDGSRVVLSTAYAGTSESVVQKPCIVVVSVQSKTRACVLELKPPGGEGFLYPVSAYFSRTDGHEITATVFDATIRTIRFEEDGAGHWRQRAGDDEARQATNKSIDWEEGPNTPPRLVAAAHGRSRVLWDPNPQLGNNDLGHVSVYHWRDATGRAWSGGLYFPVGYQPGIRYPLVIQTHGFDERRFAPDGIYSTANAAQTLAGAGFFVLQVADLICLNHGEAECASAGYDGAVQQLSAEGKIDSTRVAIEGFSWTCLYVTQAITFGQTKYLAASITDGVMQSYMTYLTTLDNGGEWPRQADEAFGPPFGPNLENWLRRSPIFNLDRTNAALQVVGEGRESLTLMWEPYAILRRLGRPVDILMLNTSEHVLTNPRVQLASKDGEVDWFRFWLQGYEDADPAKAEQYSRWAHLCDLQVARVGAATAQCARNRFH